jgi:hypothetical protein
MTNRQYRPLMSFYVRRPMPRTECSRQPAISWSGAAVSPRGADRHGRLQPYGHRLAPARYPAAPAVVRLRRSGRKIWSMTSAPVVITGRSSRR